ncbi:replicative helicase loader/inhibitor [Achromobacter mucicolens]|uniref:Replicative helicase loader/inhibitor n=1 Tax=Achromobacter mucicolens TaxID=1389922 RepID=A0ABD4YS00_9BURK|nr:replicative helicase loader/inhibitor [Achromobacter mucicolens]MDH1177948.1 replicative helicase loader/inhibitor [Achromobacter mucicolens]
MHNRDIPAFADLLAGVFDAYNRMPPQPATQVLWMRMLEPYGFDAVSAAFSQYVTNEAKYPPTPAQILALLGHGAGDNRPSADEAWATALLSRDEAETVVWTQETAQAFAACRTVLDLGDEVGARMAFKGTYDRLVSRARHERQPVAWQASLGWDAARRERALTAAGNAGLLPAPHVAALLPPPAPSNAMGDDEVAAENIARLRKLVASALSPSEKRRRAAEEASKAERERLDTLKQQSAAKVAQHQPGATA